MGATPRTINADLDATLWKFIDSGSVFLGHVRLNMQQPTPEQKIDTMLVEQCVADGYLLEITVEGMPIPRYLISGAGLMFLERDGYQGRAKREKRQERWTSVKTVGTVVYSLLALGVAIWAVIADLSR